MKWGENFNTKVAEKVVAVPGDISSSNLGIQDPYLRDLICSEIDVLISMAATTNFDERYDVAIDTNTFGALHALNFAKKCSKIKVLLHVSTAYVCKETAVGVIYEEPLWKPPADQTLAGVGYNLDIDGEKKVIDAKLRELYDANACPRTTRLAMKHLGIHRARMHGWANTYVFTKAMGEMLLEQFKGDLEVVILRPTIVTSTFMEPFPGWIEGIRTMDSILVAYGKGNLKCHIGDPETILDLVPGDMVVNAILAAITCHASQSSVLGYHIYQVGSSKSNPLKIVELQQFFYSYFIKNPWVEKDGKAFKVKKLKVFTDMNQFHQHISTRYLTFLKVLKLLNIILCQQLNTTYTHIKRKINYITRVAELYRVYVFFRGIFDDANTEKLRIISSSQSDSSSSFNFDIGSLEWSEYIMETHIPGAVKYIF